MDDLARKFNMILTKSNKDNTYKFALARFLIDYAREKTDSYITGKSKKNEVEVIKFRTIAESFLKYYWHQISKYKIQQNPNPRRLPLLVQIIHNIFGKGNSSRNFDSIEEGIKIKAEAEIEKKCFREVIPRFQKIEGVADTDRPFYTYNMRSHTISVKPQALEFFKNNHSVLYNAIVLEWAKFLEKINLGLPMLISKIERDEVQRKTPQKFKKILQIYFDRCFYCENRLSPEISDAEHFIPWSFIFDNEIWNLVLACQSCNSNKSDLLYPFEFVTKIVDRNKEYSEKISDLKKSLLRLDTDWKNAIELHYINCSEKHFPVANIKVSKCNICENVWCPRTKEENPLTCPKCRERDLDLKGHIRI